MSTDKENLENLENIEILKNFKKMYNESLIGSGYSNKLVIAKDCAYEIMGQLHPYIHSDEYDEPTHMFLGNFVFFFEDMTIYRKEIV